MAKDLRITFLLDFYGDMLTEKQREVVECRRHRHRRCKGEYKGAVERLQQYDQRGKLK